MGSKQFGLYTGGLHWAVVGCFPAHGGLEDMSQTCRAPEGEGAAAQSQSETMSRSSSGAPPGCGGGSSLGARMRSLDDSAGLRRASIREEVAQQELDEISRKNDADFEALLSKVELAIALFCLIARLVQVVEE